MSGKGKESKQSKHFSECHMTFETTVDFYEDMTNVRSEHVLKDVEHRVGERKNYNDVFKTVIKERLLSFGDALQFIHFLHTMANSLNELNHDEYLGQFNLEEAFVELNKFYDMDYKDVNKQALAIADDNSDDSE